eukprot:scaffold7382_cov41-Prasinocladus_malaysianus.AAC.2
MSSRMPTSARRLQIHSEGALAYVLEGVQELNVEGACQVRLRLVAHTLAASALLPPAPYSDTLSPDFGTFNITYIGAVSIWADIMASKNSWGFAKLLLLANIRVAHTD